LTNFGSPTQVSVVNMMGATIYPSQWMSSGVFEMNLSGIEKGFYIVRINDGGKLYSRKIIVQ
jgi:hypothetical protein